MTTMQSTMIKASMTAYSTAVGPSSLLMKRLTASRYFFMTHSSVTELMKEKLNGGYSGAVESAQLIAELAVLKVFDVLVPTWRMTTMQSTIISASMTAYSTEVGPSSFRT